MLTATIILCVGALILGILGAAKQSILYTAVGVIVLSLAVIVTVLPKWVSVVGVNIILTSVGIVIDVGIVVFVSK